MSSEGLELSSAHAASAPKASAPKRYSDGAYQQRKSIRRSQENNTIVDGNRNRNGGSESQATSKLGKVWKRITKGGTVFDGFLLAASQEVGQVILTLPYIFSLLGMTSGIVLQFVFATAAVYTNALLVNLHTEFRKVRIILLLLCETR